MKQMTKSLALIAAASGVVFGVLTPLSASASSGAQALKWTKCEGSGLDPRQRCATVSVPMDYADPDGPQIEIAVSRIRSENPDARRGALLLIPGGPGGDSMNDPSEKGQKLPQSVRDAYDLIGFAPRGMAPSTAVDCGLEQRDLARTTLLPWPAPDGSVDATMAAGKRMADACARNGGELVRHISTLNEARDLDRVRAALGERKVSAWGVSYGTYVGAAYLQLFPQRTDRVVLDSNDHPDPVHAERAWLAAFERGAEDNFPEFAKWASTPGNPDRLADTAAEVRPLFLRPRRPSRPRADPLAGRQPGGAQRQRPAPVDARLLLRPRRLPGPGPADPAPRRRAPCRPRRRDRPRPSCRTSPRSPPPPSATTPTGRATRRSTARAWPRAAPKYPLTGGMPRNAMPCAAWPWEPKEAPVHVTDRGPANVLMVQNERDVATPLSGALKLREALGRRAVMVTNDSTGHDAYLDNGTACGDATVSRFLATGKRPAADLYCE